MSQPDFARIYNAFAPMEPLSPIDPRFVDCSTVRGGIALADRIVNTIRLSKMPTCQLLCSPRGAGKTTELYRIQTKLEDSGYFVVFCEANQLLDLADIDPNLLLLAIFQRVGKEFERKTRIRLEPKWLMDLVNDLISTLPSNLEFGKENLVECLENITSDVRHNRDNRAKMRQYLNPRTVSLLSNLNKTFDFIDTHLKQQGAKGLVVIVDNLDRIARTQVDSLRTNQDVLFIDGSEFLGNLKCHVVYTIPPALLYSGSGSRLADLYHSTPDVLPLIPVATRNGHPHEAGLAILGEMVEKRLAAGGTDAQTFFDSLETMDAICYASGGYPRGLMTLMQSSIVNAESDRITRRDMETAVRSLRDNVQRNLSLSDSWQALKNIALTKTIELSQTTLALLENLLVLEYWDHDGPWFDVAPSIREISYFRELMSFGSSTSFPSSPVSLSEFRKIRRK